jgi:hypothetical protein
VSALEEPQASRGAHFPVLDEGLDEAPDGGERRLQLVGDVGDELPPDDLEAPELGDVVEDEDGPGHAVLSVPQRRGVELEGAPAWGTGEADLEALLDVVAENDLERLRHLANPGDLPDPPADALGGGGLEELPGHRVHVDHALGAVDRHDALEHAGEDGGELVPLLDEGVPSDDAAARRAARSRGRDPRSRP